MCSPEMSWCGSILKIDGFLVQASQMTAPAGAPCNVMAELAQPLWTKPVALFLKIVMASRRAQVAFCASAASADRRYLTVKVSTRASSASQNAIRWREAQKAASVDRSWNRNLALDREPPARAAIFRTCASKRA